MPRSAPAKPAAAADMESIGQSLCGRVKDLRRRKNWTLEQLAAASGVSRSMLSEIERGRANPTLAVACRIAQAFGLSLGSLIEQDGASPRVETIRADDRTYHFRNDRYCRIRTLSPLHLEKAVEYYEIILHPGAALRSAPHFKGARELLTVQSGRVKVTAGSDTSNLNTGDSAHYPADVAHCIENIATADATLFLVVTYLPD